MEEDSEQIKQIKRLIDDEYFDLHLYKLILKDIKDKKEKRKVERLYQKESKDLKTLLEFAKGYTPRLNRLKVYFYYLLYKIFGLTFIVKFAESDEEEMVKGYRDLLRREKRKEKRRALRYLIRSTKRYETMVRGWIRDRRLDYLSFIALGITDAVISLVGTQAGFLGATENSRYIALSTLIVGMATGISMGAATYIQAKEMKNGVRPSMAAYVSFLTYILISIALLLPFLLIPDPYTGFLVSFLLSIILVILFTYYSSLVGDRPFWNHLKENLFIVLLALFLGFVLGKAAGNFIEDLP